MEYSLESIMAVGTGMIASCESAGAQNNGPIEYDGYSDSLDLDIARTSEQLHFMDTYDKLQSLHSAEKLRMIKKIQTSYKTISNTNVANSVESFCNNAMSTEGVLTNIKEKLVEIFKRFCEFIKKCIMKFRMNIAKHVGLFKTVKSGFFIKDSEELINELYKKNSDLLIKISHASQISTEEKDIYLLLKSISDKMIENCFNLYLIGVHDTKLYFNLDKCKTSNGIGISVYHPTKLHAELNKIIENYKKIINTNFKLSEYDKIDTSPIFKRIDIIIDNLKMIQTNVQDDLEIIKEATNVFSTCNIKTYDLVENVNKLTAHLKFGEHHDSKADKKINDIQNQYFSYINELEAIMNNYSDEFINSFENDPNHYNSPSYKKNRKDTIVKLSKTTFSKMLKIFQKSGNRISTPEHIYHTIS